MWPPGVLKITATPGSSHPTPTLKFSSSWVFPPQVYLTLAFQPCALVGLSCFPLLVSLAYTFFLPPPPLFPFPSCPSPLCWPCSVYCVLNLLGLLQMPLAVLSLLSTIKTVPSPYLGAVVSSLYTATLVPAEPLPLSSLHKHHVCTQCTQIHEGKTHIRI